MKNPGEHAKYLDKMIDLSKEDFLNLIKNADPRTIENCYRKIGLPERIVVSGTLSLYFRERARTYNINLLEYGFRASSSPFCHFEEAATMRGCCSRTIRNWYNAGEIEGKSINGALWVKKDDVNDHYFEKRNGSKEVAESTNDENDLLLASLMKKFKDLSTEAKTHKTLYEEYDQKAKHLQITIDIFKTNNENASS